MNTISLTPTESVSLATLAKSLAKRATEFLISYNLTVALGIAALISGLYFHIEPSHPLRCAAVVMAWAVQLAAVMTKGIYEEGGDL